MLEDDREVRCTMLVVADGAGSALRAGRQQRQG